eukprot:EG_transcript_7628
MPSNQGSITRKPQAKGLPTYLEGEATVESLQGSVQRSLQAGVPGSVQGSVQRSVQGSRQGSDAVRRAYGQAPIPIPSSAAEAAPIVVDEEGSIYVDQPLPGAPVVQYDAERDAILVDEPSVPSVPSVLDRPYASERPFVVDRSLYGLAEPERRPAPPVPVREPVEAASPADSRVSHRSSRSAVERIVSLPFPSARASQAPSEPERARPDERDDIIRELRASISRLSSTAKGLEGKRESMKAANARAAEDAKHLKVEIARLTKMLDEERAVTQVNLGSEETKRREAFELVDLQRKLLLQKDDEVRQLAQLAASHKEQIFVLHSHLGSADVNAILEDSFDFRTVDPSGLDPDTRQRVMELMRGPTIDLSRGAVYVGDERAAYAADAADGVLDGQLNGRPIMVPKPKPKAVKSSGYGQRSTVSSGATSGTSGKMSELKRQLSDARQERERLGGKYR